MSIHYKQLRRKERFNRITKQQARAVYNLMMNRYRPITDAEYDSLLRKCKLENWQAAHLTFPEQDTIWVQAYHPL